MKVAIIGSTGFVGGATAYSLNQHGIETVGYHVDDATSATKEEVNECDISIVCVPTPMGFDGTCDLSILDEVMGWLDTELVVIKSTVPIGTTSAIAKTGKKVVHIPEFLREATALGDAMNPDFVLVGSPDRTIYDSLISLLGEVYPNAPIVYTTSDYSEAVKYSINSFLAYKVGFFNELHNIAEAIGLNSDEITELMLLDPRIGESHTKVTQEGGFGGHCFPKDLNALINTAEDEGYNPKLLKELWNSNRRFRKEFAGEEFNFYE